MPENSNAYLSRYTPFLEALLEKVNASSYVKDNYAVNPLSIKDIERFLSRPNYLYDQFIIIKKNSGKRIIYAPKPSLKALQQYILHIYLNENLDKFHFSKSVTGYVPKKSVVDNAEPHLNKKFLVQLDIKDFFPSITQPMVMKSIQKKLSLSYEEAYVISKLTTRKGTLPQGAPTSPFLANICATTLDNRIHAFIEWLKIKLDNPNISYTRYADDLTFSFSREIHFSRFISSIYNIIYDEGYIPNIEKTRVISSKSRQKVTGVVVNNIMSIEKKERKDLEFLLKIWLKYDFDKISSAIERVIKEPILEEKKLLEIMQGKIGFIKHINPEQVKKLTDYLNQLNIKINTQLDK